jgi:flagellar secretion chaperone FliS
MPLMAANLSDIDIAERKSLTNNNPYQAYAEGNLLSGHPLLLVVALYEGAFDSARSARLCLASEDIWGRTKAINKAISILTELMASLNAEKGGEIANNLKQLYSYMQRRLLEAHMKKTAEPIREVEALLENLLDGWRQAANKATSAERESHNPTAGLPELAVGNEQQHQANNEGTGGLYSYWNEGSESQLRAAYSF